MKTPVVFRKFKDGDIIALFPTMPWNDDSSLCLSYMHVGQHGAASAMLIYETLPAKSEEYGNLLNELKRLGYKNIVVYSRIPKWMDDKRREAIKCLTSGLCS